MKKRNIFSLKKIIFCFSLSFIPFKANAGFVPSYSNATDVSGQSLLAFSNSENPLPLISLSDPKIKVLNNHFVTISGRILKQVDDNEYIIYDHLEKAKVEIDAGFFTINVSEKETIKFKALIEVEENHDIKIKAISPVMLKQF